MNLFFMLVYKGRPIAYTYTWAQAMCYVDDIFLSMSCEKIWAKTPEELCLPHALKVPEHVWKVLKEIDLNDFLEGV